MHFLLSFTLPNDWLMVVFFVFRKQRYIYAHEQCNWCHYLRVFVINTFFSFFLLCFDCSQCLSFFLVYLTRRMTNKRKCTTCSFLYTTQRPTNKSSSSFFISLLRWNIQKNEQLYYTIEELIYQISQKNMQPVSIESTFAITYTTIPS